ncbi:MAG: helix-turn-helix domain-containing protein [Firmicutes bacterium]|nr:helix-turn-helix domain-containing protein [Bacillota bacterium]
MFKIGERIRAARQDKGLTQKQFAGILNVPANTLSQWETGRHEPPVEMIRQIAIALECDANYLLGFAD